MYIFIVIGRYIDRLYLALNPNYELGEENMSQISNSKNVARV